MNPERFIGAAIVQALVFLAAALTSASASPPSPPVHCFGPVARSSQVEHMLHDNLSSFQVAFRTHVDLRLDLNQVSCFQVDLENGASRNGTKPEDKIESMFYAVNYVEYSQQVGVRSSFKFGIPEFQSFCQCDCPGSDKFCDASFATRFCEKGEVCVQTFHANQGSVGCQNREQDANVCCEVSVRPFEGRVFTAAVFSIPLTLVTIKIDIYVLHKGKWSLSREYLRNVQIKNNQLSLNGEENASNFVVSVRAADPRLNIETWDKEYFFENTAEEFVIKESPVGSNTKMHSRKEYRFLLYENGRWNVPGALTKLTGAHLPFVTNCQAQKYVDRFRESALPFFFIRNHTGALNKPYHPGTSFQSAHHQYIEKIERFPENNMLPLKYIKISHKASSAPTITLDMELEQKIKVIAHRAESFFKDFEAEIRLDKNRNKFVNITLVNAHGQFLIEVYEDRTFLDVTLSATTDLPMAANFTDSIPLPNHIESTRYVCVFPETSNDFKICHWAKYRKDQLEWFELGKTFIASESSCPGCNVDEDSKSGSFLSFLNPKRWFNGINSVSEGIALTLEIIFYIVILVVAVAVCRKVVWPFARWALCGGPKAKARKEIRKDKDVDDFYD